MNTLGQSRGNLVALTIAFAALVWLAMGNGIKSGGAQFAVPEVELSEAKALIDAGAMVVDVRGQDQFNYRHLPGAVLIPLTVLRSGIPASLAAAKEQKIVIYCNEGLAHGPEATHILRQAGFTNVVNMKAGIESWSGAGCPIKKG